MHYVHAFRRTALALAVLLMLGSGVHAQDDHAHGDGTPRPELESASPIPLDPSRGSEIGLVYQAFLSPQQEGGEEEDTPPFIPPEFRSTAPSVPRDQRPSRGHAVIEFANDLSRAYVHLAIENVNVDEIVMLHLHCGRPGQLGPIIVDFSTIGDIQTYLADGIMTVEVVNADLEAVINASSGLIGAFTAGCPITPDATSDKIRTIAGLAYVTGQGDLYFNLHTAGQVYFGDMRGQFYPVSGSS